MSSIIPLHFEQFDVRMIMRGNVPWWVGVDAARMLGIANTRQALGLLEDYEKGVYIVDSLGGPQEMTIINESGMYSLILRSRKPTAKAFKRWLTTEVLPSIRVHGKYPPTAEADVAPALPKPLPVVETRLGRFNQECERIAAAHGEKIEKVFKHFISDKKLKAMIRGSGELDDLLTQDMRWLLFMNMGMDLYYVINGQRALTPPA